MDDISFDFDAAKLVGNITKVQMSFDNMWDSATSTTGIEHFKQAQKEIVNTEKTTSGLIGRFKSLFGFNKEKLITPESGSKELNNMNLSMAALAKNALKLGGIFFLIKGVLSSFPEFGDTLFAFGEIIKYNLLSPIRDELIPVLNSILSWASSNEKLFTRIGVAIATVFRIAVQIVKSAINSIQILFKSIFGTIEDLTGRTIGTVENTINLAATKIAATLNFIAITAEPVFKAIGNLIGTLFVGIQEFFSGISQGLGDLSEVTGNLSKLFNTLFGWLVKSKDESKEISQIWSGLGKVIGGVVRLLIRAVDLAVGLGLAIGEGISDLFDTDKIRENAKKQIISEQEKQRQGIGGYKTPERTPLQPVNNTSAVTSNNMAANANVYVTQNIYDGGQDVANEIVTRTNDSLKTGILNMFSQTLEASGI